MPLELRGGIERPANQVYRAYRYAPDYPGLQGLDLTPGEPIELYSTFSPTRTETMTVGDWVSGPLGGGPPVIRSDWDVYLVGNSLIYAKDHCSPEDAEPRFVLHLDPVDVNDLPKHRQQYGFDNLDFDFRDHRLPTGKCLAERPLPEYAISEIRTGQHVRVDGGYNHLWDGRIRLNE